MGPTARYYIMDLDKGMAETVASAMPSAAAIAACKWLPEHELRVYSAEYERTGFQGGLQEYRLKWIDKYRAELRLFSGRTIDVPSLFIAGTNDWGVYQNPGDFDRMQKTACTRMLGSAPRGRSRTLGPTRTTGRSEQISRPVSEGLKLAFTKPLISCGVYGTAEAVPLHNIGK